MFSLRKREEKVTIRVKARSHLRKPGEGRGGRLWEKLDMARVTDHLTSST